MTEICRVCPLRRAHSRFALARSPGAGSGPDDPIGLDTSGASGLDPRYADALGVYKIISPELIPPVYDAASSGVDPPSFANPGITPVVDGIWDIENLDAFRTIAGDGFSIVLYDNETAAFSQVLGRYESYECTSSGYRSVATQSSFNQTGPVYFQAAGGCSSADLGSLWQGLVRITSTIDTVCPPVDDGSNGRLQIRIARLAEDRVAERIDGEGGPLCLNKASGAAVSAVVSAFAVFSLQLLF